MRPAVLSHLRFFILLVVVFACGASSRASAQSMAKSAEGGWVEVKPRVEPPSVFESDANVRLFGFTLIAGIPDGVAPGISFHPNTNLVHLDLSLSGLLALGVRAGVTFDPFDWVVAPTLTLAGGYNGWTRLPSDAIYYKLYYVNIQPGIEVGRRSRFRVFVRAGYSHFWVASRHPYSYQGVQPTSQPSLRISGWPSVSVGLTAYFGQ